MRTKLLASLGAVAAVGTVGFASTATADAAKRPDLVIGQTGSLTGAFAPLGQASRNGALLAAQHLNRRGGVKGRKVVIKVLDDQTSPTVSVNNINRHIADGVVAITGIQSTAQSTPIVPIIQRTNVLMVLSSGMPVLSGSSTYPRTLFTNSPSVQMLGDGVACYINKVVKKKTIGMVNTSDPGTQAAANQFKARAAKLGMNVVTSQSVAPGSTDVTLAAAKVRDANPDVIANFAASTTGALFAKAVRNLGMKQPMVAYTGQATASVLKAQGPILDGMVVENYLAALDPLRHQRKFVLDYKKAFNGLLPDNQSVAGYDAVTAIAKAVARVPNATQKDGVRLARALQGQKWTGMLGAQKFGRYTGKSNVANTGPSVRSFLWTVVKDGDFVRARTQPKC